MAPRQPQDFEKFYAAELDSVWNSLRRLGVAAAHLEDLTQEVFVTAWRRLDSYDATRPIRPWLFGIAYRVASDFRARAFQHREVSDEGADAVDEAPSPADHLARKQAQALVRRGLDAMSIDRRAVFVMHELDGIAIPIVAETLEIPLNTAYSKLRLARRDFAQAVEQLQGGGSSP